LWTHSLLNCVGWRAQDGLKASLSSRIAKFSRLLSAYCEGHSTEMALLHVYSAAEADVLLYFVCLIPSQHVTAPITQPRLTPQRTACIESDELMKCMPTWGTDSVD